MEQFDIELSSKPSSAVDRHAPPQRCGYCQAPLSPFFYFCTGCGMPYKDAGSVISPEMPRQLSEGELVRMKAPAVWPMFWTYVMVILLGAGVSAYLVKDNAPELSLLIPMAGLFVTTCVFAAMYWTSLATQFARFGFGQIEAWIGLGLLVPMLGLNFAWSSLWMKLIEGLGIKAMDPFGGLEDQAFRIMAIAVFPAVIEEIAFRGLLQHWLQIAIKPWRAIFLASFLFALLHGNLIGMPYLFLVGVLLGWTKWKTGSLYPSMLIHFLHNFVVIEFFRYL